MASPLKDGFLMPIFLMTPFFGISTMADRISDGPQFSPHPGICGLTGETYDLLLISRIEKGHWDVTFVVIIYNFHLPSRLSWLCAEGQMTRTQGSLQSNNLQGSEPSSNPMNLEVDPFPAELWMRYHPQQSSACSFIRDHEVDDSARPCLYSWSWKPLDSIQAWY